MFAHASGFSWDEGLLVSGAYRARRGPVDMESARRRQDIPGELSRDETSVKRRAQELEGRN